MHIIIVFVNDCINNYDSKTFKNEQIAAHKKICTQNDPYLECDVGGKEMTMIIIKRLYTTFLKFTHGYKSRIFYKLNV